MKNSPIRWLPLVLLFGCVPCLHGDDVDDQIDALKNSHESVRIPAVEALGKSGDARAVEPLCAVLNDPDIGIRKAVAEALGQIGDARAAEPLIALLSDPDPGVRAAAVTALGKLHDAEAVGPVIKSLNDNDSGVRAAACETLGQLGDARAETPLTVCLKDNDATTRDSAAAALGKLSDARAASPLIAALKDQDPKERASAATSLGTLDDARAAQPLIAALKDVDPRVRAAAAEALANSNEAQATTALAAALPDWWARTQINRALKKLNWSPTSENEKVYFWIGNSDGVNLRDHWEKTKRILLADLQSRDQRRVLNAAYTLVALGNEEVIPNLIASLKARSSREVAVMLANCENTTLSDAARSVAASHHYTITVEPEKRAWKWGEW